MSAKTAHFRVVLKRDIPKWLFHEMLRQAGLTLEEFRTLLDA